MKRRQLIQAAGAGSVLGSLGMITGCATSGGSGGPHVVVVGGGYGGATAAKYIRMWSDQSIRVTLVEPSAAFISCPISNLVLGGSKTMADITMSYDNLVKRHGVNVVRDMVTSIDADKRTVKLAGGAVRAQLVPASHPASRGERSGLGDPNELHREVPVRYR